MGDEIRSYRILIVKIKPNTNNAVASYILIMFRPIWDITKQSNTIHVEVSEFCM